MKLTGMKQGNTIEIAENLNIPDGTQLVIEVKPVETMTIEEKLEKMKEFLESDRQGRQDFVKTLTELDEERHAAFEKRMNNADD
ncbi:hypothetical protein PMG71_11445 [Roseofilum sp. BLCC_M154]|uniref:SpoVT-AbrB domain-containing protein n=1 Tax=Roseofilum acuticapitatum BLCC-M154 TaxID=3022444 RepID=A0ABT7AT01_9CYAN|nr:hypothetical protein [Roseofilum acuticapitatum]MDJ1170042.1 hypothetical protein [Roseofilum acuticapitatum BLCC-M154]